MVARELAVKLVELATEHPDAEVIIQVGDWASDIDGILYLDECGQTDSGMFYYSKDDYIADFGENAEPIEFSERIFILGE